MIAKNIKGTSFAGCINYVMKEGAEMLKSEGVMTIDNDSIINSFEFQSHCRGEIKSPVGHIPISFAPEDKERMSNGFMVQLAEEYMKNMGIKDTQYIIIRHHDNDNEHIHIVYNRIDNNKKLISDKNDFKRNVTTCKRLKDKYNLTYGKGKDRVKRERLKGADKTKYEIYDAIKSEITRSHSFNELIERLNSRGVKTELKYRRNSDDIQGISFSKDEHKFKGSEIDRKYSYNNILKILSDKQIKATQVSTEMGGVKLSQEQRDILSIGKSTFVENMTTKSGNIYSAHVKYSEEKEKFEFFRHNPDAPKESIMQDHSHQDNENGIVSGLGLFDLTTDGGDDPEEDSFRRRMQKKKKRGFKL